MAFPWGSASITRTRRSSLARHAAVLTAEVVLPVPPFSDSQAIDARAASLPSLPLPEGSAGKAAMLEYRDAAVARCSRCVTPRWCGALVSGCFGVVRSRCQRGMVPWWDGIVVSRCSNARVFHCSGVVVSRYPRTIPPRRPAIGIPAATVAWCCVSRCSGIERPRYPNASCATAQRKERSPDAPAS